jgi:hypothetical protein
MKVKLKTKVQLIKEGWAGRILFGRRNKYGFILGKAKEPIAHISEYQLRHLGKTARVSDVDLEREEPRVLLKVGLHRSWYPWQILTDSKFIENWKDRSKKKDFGFGKVKREADGDFDFSCGLSTMSSIQTLQVIKWVAKELGYKLVK